MSVDDEDSAKLRWVTDFETGEKSKFRWIHDKRDKSEKIISRKHMFDYDESHSHAKLYYDAMTILIFVCQTMASIERTFAWLQWTTTNKRKRTKRWRRRRHTLSHNSRPWRRHSFVSFCFRKFFFSSCLSFVALFIRIRVDQFALISLRLIRTDTDTEATTRQAQIEHFRTTFSLNSQSIEVFCFSSLCRTIVDGVSAISFSSAGSEDEWKRVSCVNNNKEKKKKTKFLFVFVYFWHIFFRSLLLPFAQSQSRLCWRWSFYRCAVWHSWHRPLIITALDHMVVQRRLMIASFIVINTDNQLSLNDFQTVQRSDITVMERLFDPQTADRLHGHRMWVRDLRQVICHGQQQFQPNCHGCQIKLVSIEIEFDVIIGEGHNIVSSPNLGSRSQASAGDLKCTNNELDDTFCSRVQNYPLNTILQLIQRHPEAKFFRTDDVIPEVSNRGGFDDGSEQLCQYQEKVIYPQSGMADDDSLQIIVNTDDVRQGVHVQMCANTSDSCSPKISVPNNYRTFCQQNYIYRELLSASTDGTHLEKRRFKVPSCCSCLLQRIHW